MKPWSWVHVCRVLIRSGLLVHPGPVYLITELCCHGDLLSYLQRNKATFLQRDTPTNRWPSLSDSRCSMNQTLLFSPKHEHQLTWRIRLLSPDPLNVLLFPLTAMIQFLGPSVTVMEDTWTWPKTVVFKTLPWRSYKWQTSILRPHTQSQVNCRGVIWDWSAG